MKLFTYFSSRSKFITVRAVALSTLIATSMMSTTGYSQEIAPTYSSLDDLTNDFIEEGYYFYPMSATFNGKVEFNNKYTPPLTRENKEAKLVYYRKYLSLLNEIDREKLKDDEKVTYDLFRYRTELDLDRLSFPEFLLNVNQISGAHIHFAMLGSGTSGQPFNNEDDYRNFIGRSVGFSKWIDSFITAMTEAAEQKQTLSKRVVEKVLLQLKQYLVADVESSVFYQPLNKLPEGLSPKQKDALVAEYAKNIQQVILPAYRKLYTFFKEDYADIARTSIGIVSDKSNLSWYEFYIKEHTTQVLTAKDIHAFGKQTVHANLVTLNEIKSQLGFSGTLANFFNQLRANDKFYFESKDDLLNAYQQARKKSQNKVGKLFDIKLDQEFQVAAVPDFAAEQAPRATYRPPASDGSRPGILYINAHDLRSQPKYLVETVTLHEASPGHHLQHLMSMQNVGLSNYRKSLSFTAFNEGWGLYAEGLGKELGFYSDPMMMLGRVLADQQRAMRLVVDTGIHAFDWSYEQAKSYMMANSSLTESEVEAEIDRYIAHPGQALGYKIGERKIVELKDFAKQRLGSNFNIKEFHTVILSQGSLPMLLLEQQVKQWVLTKQLSAGIKLKLDTKAKNVLTDSQQQLLINTINEVTKDINQLLLEFPAHVTVSVSIVDRNLDNVGGVTGIAQTPTLVNIDISSTYKSGIDKAIKEGLRHTLYHEYHHLVKGWTIEENKFGPGIAIAAVNEGLASVFADEYSGVEEKWSIYPSEIIAWVEEILDLPVNASYEEWMMGAHPDGRQNIGYKAGKYIVHQAMKRSAKSIVELSKLSPFEILDISGVINSHSPSLEKLGDSYAKNKLYQAAIKSYKRALEIVKGVAPDLAARYKSKINLAIKPVILSSSQLNEMVGEYYSERMALIIFIAPDSNQLYVQISGKPPFELHAKTAQTFFIYEAEVKFKLIEQNNEQPTKLLVNMYGRELELNKKKTTHNDS